jgi:hypothetical protein
MKKPKCRLCGHEHYSHEAYLFAPAAVGRARCGPQSQGLNGAVTAVVTTIALSASSGRAPAWKPIIAKAALSL